MKKIRNAAIVAVTSGAFVALTTSAAFAAKSWS